MNLAGLGVLEFAYNRATMVLWKLSLTIGLNLGVQATLPTYALSPLRGDTPKRGMLTRGTVHSEIG